MPLPQIFITPAGFAAIVNAENTGTAPVKLTQVGLTSQSFDPTAVGSALPGEFKRLTTFGGVTVAPDTLHLNVRDDGPDTYTVRGFGLYLADGTLLGVYSQPAPIMEKAEAATLLLATDIRFANIDATSITVGDVDFVNPPATTTRAGVARFANEQETDSASDGRLAISAEALGGYINRRFGNGAPSSFAKKLLSVATAAIFRAELGLKTASLRDEGHGNGLDADLLDGVHGDHYLDWRNFTNVPSSFTPAKHTHPIGEVDGLQTALDGKASRGGDTFSGPVSVNGYALRAYGWNGTASDGRLILGDASSYIAKHGAYFEFANAAGGYTAVLSAGGTIWTSGNFDPATKVNRSGGTLTGDLNGTGFHTQYPVALPADPGAEFALARIGVNTGGNQDYLRTFIQRTGSANGWSTARFVIARVVDATTQGFIQFNGSSEGEVMSFGYNRFGVAQFSTSRWKFSVPVEMPAGYDVGSSRKLKEIEGPIPYGLEQVDKMEIVAGSYKPTYYDDGRKRLFLVAENIAELIPEAVSSDAILFEGERVGAVKMEQLLPVAFRAIQQLHALVQEQSRQIQALHDRR